MYCTRCGTPIPQGATQCPSCGHPAGRFPIPPQIPNYLAASILVTLCCCLPFGIVALVYASQVNSKLAAGDVAGAQIASNNARLWCWIAFIVGIFTAGGLGLFQWMNR